MTLVWGGVLAAGVLLLLSPWVWPRRVADERPAPHTRTAALLQQAGFAHTPTGRLWTISAGLGILASASAWIVTALPVVALLAAIVAAAAPAAWLRGRARHLRKARRMMWPDVCDLLIASVRAGMPLTEAVSSVATSGPPALRPAFAGFAADVAASGHFDSSAVRLKTTLADPIADRIVESLRMARQVGGTELVAVLQALSTSVRAETALRAEVEARQSWIRGAAVLGLVAPWVILVLLALRPEGARAYASGEGIALIVGGAVVSFIAFRVMLHIGRLPEPRRWST